MVDPTDKDTKHNKDRSTGTEGYLEYTEENEKGKVNRLDVGNNCVGLSCSPHQVGLPSLHSQYE